MRRIAPLAVLPLLVASYANAVVVRGKVTTPLGVPVAGARVQLIQGPRSVADTISGSDGTYEIRSPLSGRFLLLAAPAAFARGLAPQIGHPFYGGPADLVLIDVALNHAGITPQLSSQPTFLPTPPAQLSVPVAQIAADDLLTHISLIPELRRTSSAFLFQQGELGNPAFLYLRGAPPATLLATLDGVTVNPLGSAFNLSTFSVSALSEISSAPAAEVTSTANPLHPIDASGGTLGLHSAAAQSVRPSLIYTGDAGTLDALHNEAVASLTHNRFDVLADFARFDTSNDLPATKDHLITYAGNAGYHISGGTSLRATFRDDLAATGLTSPYELFHLTPSGRDAHQNILTSGTFDTRTARNWHNALTYGLARLRQQTFDYATPASGLPVTITGANGYTGTGSAAFIPLPPREDAITNRDQATYQTDYPWKPWLNLLAQVRYEDDRAADILPTQKQTLNRTHFAASGGLQGEIRHRLFYQASGSFDHSTFYGAAGNPRLGLTYAPVRPGTRKFRGTSLHATASTGTRETSLLEEASVTGSRVQPRSRTYDLSADQQILPQKLTFRGTYFHSQFSHEFEPLSISLATARPNLSQTLALRTQGFESELRYQPFQRITLEGGYTYLAALTEQTAATPTFNPAYPATLIGALTALAGRRPFNRPPQSGFFLAEYSGSKLNVALKGSLVSRSDSSTYLVQTPALLLPNRDLSPSYTSLDANFSYAVAKRITVISQLTNLTDDRHLAPIGFLSTPFLARAGLRIRFGGE